uniref:Uncharacterized protein LOC117349553 isoform X3 n=2 Tax=Geotrypetes seraphini TaxID=260995 RepID=A0A6P8PUJ0_GEOSA|nr:uncharacterized protein LOC117349553 isoform X3 [Geotrypetes seraphini]
MGRSVQGDGGTMKLFLAFLTLGLSGCWLQTEALLNGNIMNTNASDGILSQPEIANMDRLLGNPEDTSLSPRMFNPDFKIAKQEQSELEQPKQERSEPENMEATEEEEEEIALDEEGQPEETVARIKFFGIEPKEQSSIIGIVTALLAVMALVGLYYYFLHPKKHKKRKLQHS